MPRPVDPNEFYTHLTSCTAAANLSSLLLPTSIRRRHRVNTVDVGGVTHVFRCPINVLSCSVDKNLAPSAGSGIGTTRTGTAGQITTTDGCGCGPQRQLRRAAGAAAQ